MDGTYLIRGAPQLITLQGRTEARRGSALSDLAIINNGSLLVRDGIIQEAGTTKRVENLAAARRAEVIEARGYVVMPAFVDSAVSLVFSHSSTDRNYERLTFGRPQTPASQRADIINGVRGLKLVSKRRLILRGQEIAMDMARHGTGTAGVISGYGPDQTGEVKTLRSVEALNGRSLNLINSHLGANFVPDEFVNNPEAFLRKKAIPMLATIAHRKLAIFAAIRCCEAAFNLESGRDYLRAAANLGLACAVYSQQFASDESVRLALEFDAASITHLEYLTGWHIDLLAASRAVAVLTPAATIHMGLERFAPARRLVDRGAAIALATAFNPDFSPSYSMPYVISLACRYLSLSPAEAICAATINAAHALRCGHLTGSLEIGKQADLVILNMRDYRDLPMQPGVNPIRLMMKKGVIIDSNMPTELESDSYDN